MSKDQQVLEIVRLLATLPGAERFVVNWQWTNLLRRGEAGTYMKDGCAFYDVTKCPDTLKVPDDVDVIQIEMHGTSHDQEALDAAFQATADKLVPYPLKGRFSQAGDGGYIACVNSAL